MKVDPKKLSILVPVVMLPLGLWLGSRILREHGGSGVWNAVTAIPTANLALAFAFATASYLCLTFFDVLGVRYVGRPLAYRKIALTSFVSLSIGHTVGVAMLSSGALRYRFYAAYGFGAAEVAQIMALSALTVAVGLSTLGGVALVIRPELGIDLLDLSPFVARAIGILGLMFVALYLLMTLWVRGPIHLRGRSFRLPSLRIAVAQVALGTVNFALVAAALHQLLAGAAAYMAVAPAYVLGNLAGLLSHVPGGIGVLEYVVSVIVSGNVSQGNVVGALVAFRIVYYFVPLLLGLIILSCVELSRLRRSAHG